MPTYQYACTECGHQLEAVQSFTDDPLTQCPECQGRLRKRFGSVGVVFKGSGFYRTDSRAAANGASRNGKKDAADSSGDKGGGKSAGTSGGSGSGGSDGSGGEAKSGGAGKESGSAGGGTKEKSSAAKSAS